MHVWGSDVCPKQILPVHRMASEALRLPLPPFVSDCALSPKRSAFVVIDCANPNTALHTVNDSPSNATNSGSNSNSSSSNNNSSSSSSSGGGRTSVGCCSESQHAPACRTQSIYEPWRSMLARLGAPALGQPIMPVSSLLGRADLPGPRASLPPPLTISFLSVLNAASAFAHIHHQIDLLLHNCRALTLYLDRQAQAGAVLKSIRLMSLTFPVLSFFPLAMFLMMLKLARRWLDDSGTPWFSLLWAMCACIGCVWLLSHATRSYRRIRQNPQDPTARRDMLLAVTAACLVMSVGLFDPSQQLTSMNGRADADYLTLGLRTMRSSFWGAATLVDESMGAGTRIMCSSFSESVSGGEILAGTVYQIPQIHTYT
jgi:hypothetical protein